MDDYQKFIAISRYARWDETKGRRETYEETVDRYVLNVIVPRLLETNLSKQKVYQVAEELSKSIKNMEAMPSMRALMTAGEALRRDNVCAFNCAYTVVEHIEDFVEAMYILLCGTGVGFSVERQYVSKLPTIPHTLYPSKTVTVEVQDSKEGWADALREQLEWLMAGIIPNINTDRVRPAGAVLKTFGGRASGPEPLIELFEFIVETFKKAAGRKLTSLECHDIMCKIAEIVVVGGVRRSAMISLSNLSDDRMRHAKMGDWYTTQKQRGLANNSVAYTEKPDSESFLREWVALIESKSGERGIFNRAAAVIQASKNGRRKVKLEEDVNPYIMDGPYDPNLYIPFGTNPCSEIILRPRQFCNLTEVVCRSGDTFDTIKEKIKHATIMGTIQASLTHFPNLRKEWKDNTEEEALLGLSLTGIMDSKWLRECRVEELEWLKEYAIGVNAMWARILGIKPSAAITCVKPSGTVSQLVNSASGIHTRFAKFYMRSVRADNKDPLTQFMKDQGIPHERCVSKPDSTTIFFFPVRAPDKAVVTADLTAVEQLEVWLKFQRHWCEHKPSVTINVRSDEWPEVGAFVYKHFDEMSGVSFLPYDDHIYQQAPYTPISEEKYEEALSKMPANINWEALAGYEKTDMTSSSQTFACVGGSCEIVDLT